MLLLVLVAPLNFEPNSKVYTIRAGVLSKRSCYINYRCRHYKLCIQMMLKDGVYKWCIKMVDIDNVKKWTTQMVFKNGLKRW
jgi:hypothetical protein